MTHKRAENISTIFRYTGKRVDLIQRSKLYKKNLEFNQLTFPATNGISPKHNL